MPNIIELKKQRAERRDALSNILSTASLRNLSPTERDSAVNELNALANLQENIEGVESTNTLSRALRNGRGAILPANPNAPDAPGRGASGRRVLSADYQEAYRAWIGSGGQVVDAALYEGAGSSGGYTVPTLTDGQVVPLAAPETGVRRIATVMPTVADLKIPTAQSFGTAAIKAESGSSASSFADSDPTLGQVTLSAFMMGRQNTVSWELTQDVPAFNSFIVADLLTSIALLEESYFVSGTGTGQPQGLIGNVGTSLAPLSHTATASDLLDATLAVQGSLNAVYHPGASYLMSRAVAVSLRQAQKAANLYEPAWTSSNGQDYLWGVPVVYSASMPALAAGATPILYGDFKAGYVIGDRGGAGVNLLFLDQPKATQGQLVVLGYRRTDGRVRRSEAIQAITIAAS
ncbi:MAG TPA: phage major capsid protein [Granulicella sp.]